MRAPYLECRFKPYYAAAILPDGSVELAKAEGRPVMARVDSMAQAERLIKDREDVLDLLQQVAAALAEVDPEKFGLVWSGSERRNQ